MESVRNKHMRRAIAMSRRAIRTNRGVPFGGVDRRRIPTSRLLRDEAVTAFDDERPDKMVC